MESTPLLRKLSDLCRLIYVLAEEAIFYKAGCLELAAALHLLEIPLKELQENRTPLHVEELSILNRLEFTCSRIKDLLDSCGGRACKSILVLGKEQIFKDLSAKLHLQLSSLPLDTLGLSEPSKELIQRCLTSLESIDFHTEDSEEHLSEEVRRALAEIRKGRRLLHGELVHLAGILDLNSNQEILREASLLEKEKQKAHASKEKGEEELLDLLIVLVTQMSDDLAGQKQLQPIDGRVVIPADFRCPLSLELMSDPVIVASGQTYERAHIQQWLNEGNTTCPKSRQPLNHTNLINNFTVKALIASWCEQNDVPLPVSDKPQMIPAAQVLSPERPIMGVMSTQHDAHDVAPPGYSRPSVRSMRTLQSRHENLDPRRENRGEISILDERRGLSRGGSRERVNGHNPHEQEVENLANGSVGHSWNMSASSRGSSLDDVSTSTNLESNLILSNGFSPYSSDVSGELGSSVLARISNEEYASALAANDHGYSPRSRETGNVSTRVSRNTVSGANSMRDDDGDDLQFRVQQLVRELGSSSHDDQRKAAMELRLLAKYNVENRIIIANSGAIPPLVSLLHSDDPQIQENAVTALLNLSINNNNKSEIASANPFGPLVHVLKAGTSEARENTAATLFSLSVMEENRMVIGQSGAIDLLVDLLLHGRPRGKKDAATALFNLSILHDNKIRIVRANAVRPLVSLMLDPSSGMVDKAVAVISNLATIPEGRTSIGEEDGIPALVEVVEMGSQRGRENAAAALFHLCSNNNRYKSRVLQEGVIPRLVALSRSGTPRAKEKASALLRLLREQRHGRGGDTHGDRR